MIIHISIHDIHPGQEKELNQILEVVHPLPFYGLVTPFWEQKHALHSDFCSIWKNYPLLVHGLHHQSAKKDWWGQLLLGQSNSAKELFGLSREETNHHLSHAFQIFMDHFSSPPKGYIPPMWYHNAYSQASLKEMGIRYTESPWHIYHIQQSTRYFSPALCFDFGSNKVLEKLSMHLFSQYHLTRYPLRVSLHPADVRKGYLPRIQSMLQQWKNQNAQFRLPIFDN